MAHYICDSHSPSFNLALEQVLLRHAPVPSFWLWRNLPSVILGRHQVAAAEVDLAEAARRNIPVIARSSGGGAVFHDLGVVNFTFILPAWDPVSESLGRIVGLLDAPCAFTERNDVVSGGRKFLGTAQQLAGGRRLFHGSILYDADLALLARLLTPSQGKLRRHGVSSVRSRVENLRAITASPLSTDQFFQNLRQRASQGFAGPPQPLPEDFLEMAGRFESR